MDCNCFAGFLPTAPIFQRRLLLFRTHWAFLDILHQFRLELIMTMVLVVMSLEKHHNPENTTFIKNYCIKSQTRKFTTFTLKSPSIQRQTCFLTFGENHHCNHRNHLRWDPSHHNKHCKHFEFSHHQSSSSIIMFISNQISSLCFTSTCVPEDTSRWDVWNYKQILFYVIGKKRAYMRFI